MLRFKAFGHQSWFEAPIRVRGPLKTGHLLVLLTALDVVGWGVLAPIFSALLDAITDDMARQISISLPLMGNGHLIWLLVIIPFLIVV